MNESKGVGFWIGAIIFVAAILVVLIGVISWFVEIAWNDLNVHELFNASEMTAQQSVGLVILGLIVSLFVSGSPTK